MGKSLPQKVAAAFLTRKPRELMFAREDGPRYKEVAEARGSDLDVAQ